MSSNSRNYRAGFAVLAVLVAATMIYSHFSTKSDQTVTACKQLVTGNSASALANQNQTQVPGEYTISHYTLDGRRLADWNYPDGVVLTWYDGYVISKLCG
jgi:hypothetical protein